MRPGKFKIRQSSIQGSPLIFATTSSGTPPRILGARVFEGEPCRRLCLFSSVGSAQYANWLPIAARSRAMGVGVLNDEARDLLGRPHGDPQSNRRAPIVQ